MVGRGVFLDVARALGKECLDDGYGITCDDLDLTAKKQNVELKRGDYISKSAGKVKQILPDKVIVQIEEQSEDRKRFADRVIELHDKDDRIVR